MSQSTGTLLVTGAAGFIGSNFVRMLAERGYGDVVALDSLTYAGNLANISDLIDAGKLKFEKADIRDADAMKAVFDKHGIKQVAHFAAESHVDRSILGSADFVTTNVVGTQVLLDLAKAAEVTRFLNVGTDEVYGTLPEDKPEVMFTEETPLQPNSPYSASKAGGDCLCRAYFETHKMPVLITRCSNNYGPYQFPEKLIPLFVTNLMEGKQVPLYGDGLNIRDWLHVIRSLRRDSDRPGEGHARRGLQRRREQRADEPGHHREAHRALRPKLGRGRHVRRRPQGPRPALRDRSDEDQERARLGAQTPLGRSHRRHRRVVQDEHRVVAVDQERGVPRLLRNAVRRAITRLADRSPFLLHPERSRGTSQPDHVLAEPVFPARSLGCARDDVER